MDNFLKISIVIIVFVVLYNVTTITGRGNYQKSNHKVKIRGSPFFCAQKFNSCLAKGKKMRKPYGKSPAVCERHVYRTYYCTPKQIYKNFTDEERKKYFIKSRNLGFDVGNISQQFSEIPSAEMLFPPSKNTSLGLELQQEQYDYDSNSGDNSTEILKYFNSSA